MLVYGDRQGLVLAAELLADIVATVEAADACGGHRRHDLLTRALIGAGQLAQGIADEEMRKRGCDEISPLQDAAMAFAVGIAGKLFGTIAPPPPPLVSDQRICVKEPEGYAFYAVYPDRYFEVASAFPWESPPLVIGLRSIGTSLAACVAAATGGTAISLRPVGHPFRRELRVTDSLRRRLSLHAGPFALVDEGPGLSGSSFGAAADLLEELGIERSRIVFLPSHVGEPGPQAAPTHRARWRQARKAIAALDDSALEAAVQDWFGDLAGPIRGFEDLSGGAWRRDLPERDWPPVHVMQERRKYRWRAGAQRHVARFAGLGAHGEAKLARARILHEGGFGAAPLVLRRGFLLQPWIEGRPLDPAGPERARFLDHLGRYLGFRARALPAGRGQGASLSALRQMCVTNAAIMGADFAEGIEDRLAGLDALESRSLPVQVDGRLHAWEWLRTDSGFLKADALDHCCDHGLVGCQDVAWDIAGATIEFGLSQDESAALLERVAADAGRPVSIELVAMLRLCYAAYQWAAWHMAEQAAVSDERPRIRKLLAGYRQVLMA